MTLAVPLPNGSETTGREVEDLSVNLVETQTNIQDLRDKTEDVKGAVENTRWALEQVAEVRDQATEFIGTIKSMKFSLKLAEKVGPLKLPAKFVKNVLDNLEDVAVQVRKKAASMATKIENGRYIEKLEEAEEKLDDFDDGLKVVEGRVQQYGSSLNITLFAFDVVGSPLDPLESAANTASTPINDVLVAVNRTYNAIEAEIDAIQDAFSITSAAGAVTNLFADLASVAKAFGSINGSLRFLKGPLDAVQTALKPVEWLLDAVGFIYDITVGPVIDFILDKLGVTRIMDRLGDEIAKLLPDVNVLDAMEARITDTFEALTDFITEQQAALEDYVDEISEDVIDALQGASPDALRFGDEETNTIHGRSDAIDILNGLEGNDTLYGYAQGANPASATTGDLFIASSGEDFYFGGAGTDYLVLRGNLDDFRITQFSDTAPVIFLDQQGRWGREVAEGIEEFIFNDGVYTLQELKDLGVLAPAETEGDDLIIGGSGDDLIAPLGGSDTVDGREGSDTILFPGGGSERDVQVFLDQARSDAAGKEYEGSAWNGRERDFLDSIENVIVETGREARLYGNAEDNLLISGGGKDFLFGLAGDDVLYSADGDDVLVGGDGRDELYAGDGDDVLFGGAALAGQGEYYDGGFGTFDRLSYSEDLNYFNSDVRNIVRSTDLNGSGPLRINVAAGTVEHMDGETVLATDQFFGIEYVIASDSDDVIFGAPSPDDESRMRIDGARGDDTIFSGGADSVFGGAGSDTVFVTSARGYFEGGNTGGDSDTLDLRPVGDVRFLVQNRFNQRVDYYAFGDFETEVLGDQNGDPVGGLIRLATGQFNGFETILLGDGNDHYFAGGTARNEIFAAGGDDLLIRKQGNDGGAQAIFHGGDGNDTIEFETDGNEAYGDAGDDRFIINTSENDAVIEGGTGDDFIRLTRFGGTLDGGDGYDVLSLEGRFTYRSEVDLLVGTAQAFFRNNLNNDQEYVEITSLTGIEEVIGGEAVRDDINGSNAADRLIGRGDNDTLDGRDGDDELFGGDGDDSLDGGDGDDFLHGGAGDDTLNGGFRLDEVDTASYANARFDGEEGTLEAGDFGGVSVDLFTGRASGAQGADRLIGIENVIGSMGDDTLLGNRLDNVLSGGAGNDSLDGRDGNDVLVMGEGTDTANGGDGDDTFIIGLGNAVVDGGEGHDVVDFGSVDGDISFDFENFTYEAILLTDVAVWRDGGGSSARVWNGTALTPQDIVETEAAFANSADDLTRAVPGANDPDREMFEVVFSQTPLYYTGTFTNVEELSTGNGDDTIIGFDRDEVIMGAAGNDSLSGGRGNDTLKGDTGNDDMMGGVGEDLLESGTGHDTMRGGRGEDTLMGEDGNDVLRGQRNADTLEGGAGEDNLKGGGGNDHLDGGTGRDFLKGGTRADVILGGSGNDMLFGNSFDDLLDGGAGNDVLNAGGDDDTLIGGAGNDRMKGGSGADLFVFDIGHGSDVILDFEDDVDTLQFTSALTGGITDIADLLDTFAESAGGHTVFDFGNGQVIDLRGIGVVGLLGNDIEVIV